jgi:hypothetical protein
MRTISKFLVSLQVVTFFLIVACDEGPVIPVITTPPAIQEPIQILDWDFEEGVYIAGKGYSTEKGRNIAQVWGNGKLQVITDGEIGSIATSIYVSGDEVFLAGYACYWDFYPYKAMIWRNGMVQPLTNGNYESGSFSIVAWNDDVYVAGYESSVAMLWKNGVPIPLSDATVPTHATSLFVSNGDVYVVGNERHADFNKAILWKNGKPQYLSGGSYATSVFVSGNDVYVAGGNELHGMVWKNGVEQILFSHGDNSYASSVYVAGEDVYVAGYEHQLDYTYSFEDNIIYGPAKALVWKNGVPTPLTNGSQDAKANSISVSGDDVYVVGYKGDTAVIWKNGIANSLGNGYASAVFIRK